MKTLWIFTLTFLATTSAFAQGIKRYTCAVQQPCEHSDVRLLGSCLRTVDLYLAPDGSSLAVSNLTSFAGIMYTITTPTSISQSNKTLFMKSLPGFFAALDPKSPTQYRAIFTIRSNFSFQALCTLDPATKF